ncbi:MAG TPA: CT253 family lipoprotein [Rhabdochlamydiaceae bacterium]|nr:CT253 family lipoprotein [Rhabdochlamydiaceae bacterium]
MSRTAIVICLAALAAGCHDDSESRQAYYYEEKEAVIRPVVALVPIIDSTTSELPWSLSDELTTLIQERLRQKDKLHLIEDHRIRSITKKLSSSDNPFANDISWIKTAFANDEFVVFVELIEHDELPINGQKSSFPKECSYELNMTARIRVVDLRTEQPQIVLQELIHDTHFIPKRFSRFNFEQVSWGEDHYNISPLGIAHGALSKEIAKRVEDYILLSQSK